MTKQGVWDLQDVRDKALKGDWNYQTPGGPFTLWAWGNNSNPATRSGMLGLNDIVQRSSPTQVGTDQNWNNMGASNFTTIATKTDGTLWVWGSNGTYGQDYGKLGLNAPNPTSISSPTQIGTDTNWGRAYSWDQLSAAVKTNGELYVWGYGEEGAIGENSRTNRSSPVQVPGTNWSTADGHLQGAANNAAYAIRTDGTLWSWGINRQNGQLGLNSLQDKSSPTQIGTATNWSWVRATGQAVWAVNTDGQLWAWGYNENGRLGQNGSIAIDAKISSPTQIPGTTWSQVGGRTNVLALKTDGTLWGWGTNNGGLGLNDLAERSSPTQIGTDTDWAKVNLDGTGAIKNNGTIWVWGGNTYGKLGLNQPDGTKYSSPVQLPGSYDSVISGVSRPQLATKPIE